MVIYVFVWLSRVPNTGHFRTAGQSTEFLNSVNGLTDNDLSCIRCPMLS